MQNVITTIQFWFQSLERLSLDELLRTRMRLVKLALAIVFYYWLIFIWDVSAHPGSLFTSAVTDHLTIVEWGVRLSRMWRILQIEEDLQNDSRTTAEFMNCFIINSKYFSVLNMLTCKQTFFKTLAYFSSLFQDINSCCFSFFADTPKSL